MASRSIICRSWRLRQIIDLRDTGKSWYFVITEFNNCFIIRSYFNHFLTAQGSNLPFFSRKRCSYYAWAEYHLQKNTFRRYYAWADHYLQAVICRSRGGLLANENGGKNPSNDNVICQWRVGLQDTGKSRYFVIAEFNNCFIIRSPRLFSYFNHFLTAKGSSLPFFLSKTLFLLRMSRIVFAEKHV